MVDEVDAPAPTRGAAEGGGGAAEGGGGAEVEGDGDAPQWLLQAEATLASSSSSSAAAVTDTAAADTAAATAQALLPARLHIARRALAAPARCAAVLPAAAERAALQQSLWWWIRRTANLAMARASRAVAHWLAMRGALRQMRRRAGGSPSGADVPLLPCRVIIDMNNDKLDM